MLWLECSVDSTNRQRYCTLLHRPPLWGTRLATPMAHPIGQEQATHPRSVLINNQQNIIARELNEIYSRWQLNSCWQIETIKFDSISWGAHLSRRRRRRRPGQLVSWIVGAAARQSAPPPQTASLRRELGHQRGSWRRISLQPLLREEADGPSAAAAGQRAEAEEERGASRRRIHRSKPFERHKARRGAAWG
jgi:hypothetical protein